MEECKHDIYVFVSEQYPSKEGSVWVECAGCRMPGSVVTTEPYWDEECDD